MQDAAGATPPRQPVHLYYGRDLRVEMVQSQLSGLAGEAWDTADPPAAAPPSLVAVARAVHTRLTEEHDVTMYDPSDWGRVAIWYAKHLCELILAGRLADAAELLCTPTVQAAISLPAPRFLPRMCSPVPRASDYTACKRIVEDYSRYMQKRVDRLYKRAFVEIHLDTVHELRCRVYDFHPTLVLLDSVFEDRDHPMYLQLRQFELARPQDHYEGRTELAYLPHVHAVCKWITYANQQNRGITLALTVGNSRCRDIDSDITGFCWVSRHLCGFFSQNGQLVADACRVWDLLVLLNQRYVPR